MDYSFGVAIVPVFLLFLHRRMMIVFVTQSFFRNKPASQKMALNCPPRSLSQLRTNHKSYVAPHFLPSLFKHLIKDEPQIFRSFKILDRSWCPLKYSKISLFIFALLLVKAEKSPSTFFFYVLVIVFRGLKKTFEEVRRPP